MRNVICIGNPSKDIIVFNNKKNHKKGGGVYHISKVLSEKNISHKILSISGRDFGFEDSSCADMSSSQLSKKTTSVLIDKDERDAKLLSYSGEIDTKNFPKGIFKDAMVLISTIFEDVPLDFIQSLKNKFDAKIFLDVQGFTRSYDNKGNILRKSFDLSLLSDLDVVKLNKREFFILFDGDLKKMISEAKKLNIKAIILTLDKEGVKYYNLENEDLISIKGSLVEDVDNTGSGDNLLARYFTKVYAGMDGVEAIKESQDEVIERLRNLCEKN